MAKSNFDLKSLATNSTVLLLSSVLLKFLQFLLFPFYTRCLGPSELGAADAILAFAAFLFPLLVLGLDSAFCAYYFDRQDDALYQKQVFNTCFWTLLILGVLPLLALPFSGQISLWVMGSQEHSLLVGLRLLSVSLQLWGLSFALDLRINNHLKAYALILTAASFLQICVTLLGLFVFKMGAAAFIWAFFIYSLAYLLLFLWRGWVKPEPSFFSAPLLKRFLAFGVPLLPNTLSLILLLTADRMLILHFLGEGPLGLYGVGLRITTLINLFISSVSTAYTSFAFGSEGLKTQSVAHDQYRRVLHLLSFLLLGMVFTLSVFSREVIALFAAKAYQESYITVQNLVFGQVLYAIAIITAYGISFKKKAYLMLYATVPATALNLLANLLVIPRYGIYGASLTTLLAYGLIMVLTVLISKAVYPCDYRLPRILIATALLYAIALPIRDAGFLARLLPYGLGILALCFLLSSAFLECLGIAQKLFVRLKARFVQ